MYLVIRMMVLQVHNAYAEVNRVEPYFLKLNQGSVSMSNIFKRSRYQMYLAKRKFIGMHKD